MEIGPDRTVVELSKAIRSMPAVVNSREQYSRVDARRSYSDPHGVERDPEQPTHHRATESQIGCGCSAVVLISTVVLVGCCGRLKTQQIVVFTKGFPWDVGSVSIATITQIKAAGRGS